MEILSKKKKISQPDVNIIFRVSMENKKNFKMKAHTLGITLTELIVSSLNNIKVPDRRQYIIFYDYLNKLIKEMNHIGVNINQVTTAINQIKNRDKMQIGEFEVFNKLFQEYISKRDVLKETLNQIIFNETHI